jgi:beta-phosphoglucomutase-like phosphatase (HAD superfamily)
MTVTVTAALFDADGTLAASNYRHVITWWEAFAQAEHGVPMAAIHRGIGMDSDQPLDALLPTGRDREAEPSIRTAHGALPATYWSRLSTLDQIYASGLRAVGLMARGGLKAPVCTPGFVARNWGEAVRADA